MNIIDYKTKHRKYKIATILGEEYNDMDFIKIYNHYKQNMDISKMKVFRLNNYPNRIYYGYSIDDIFIEQNIKTNIFWLDNNKIWSFFETEFGYNYQETRELTATILKEHINLKEFTTSIRNKGFNKLLKEHINLKEVTTGNVLNLQIQGTPKFNKNQTMI